MLIVLFIRSILDLNEQQITFKHLTSIHFQIHFNSFSQTSLFFRLFDSENVTCDESHMWLCQFNHKERVRIIINLSVSKKLHGLRIWNYNRSSEDTYRGVN